MMMTQKTVDPKTEFSETLKILATKLTKTEYERVTGTMFGLYCGLSYGFNMADVSFIPTIMQTWDDSREDRIKQLATIKRFTVYENNNVPAKK
jgi:hypothetical protein